MKLLKRKIKILEGKLAREVALDISFPDRKDSKTELLKAEIIDLYRQLDELK